MGLLKAGAVNGDDERLDLLASVVWPPEPLLPAREDDPCSTRIRVKQTPFRS
jgi:hypothetical protein